jgi:hypothetical protein
MMRKGLIRELDHFLCKVARADHAASAFDAVGFTTTPLSRLNGLGVENCLVAFNSPQAGCANFIELLSIADPDEIKPSMRKLLMHGDGIRSLILSGPDAAKARPEFDADGYNFDEPVYVERDWVTRSGRVLRPCFTVLPPLGDMWSFAYCEFGDPSPYYDREWVSHENGVTGVTGIVATSHAPDDKASEFARLFGVDVVQDNTGFYCSSPGQVALKIGTPELVHEMLGLSDGPHDGYTALILGSNNIDATLARMKHGGAIIDTVPMGWLATVPGVEEIPLIFERQIHIFS